MRCFTKRILNIVKNKIMVYKKMSLQQWKEERANELAQLKSKRSHHQVRYTSIQAHGVSKGCEHWTDSQRKS